MPKNGQHDLKVYYNSACPVCKAGIERERGHFEQSSARDDVEWIDIASDPDALAPLGLDIDDVRHSLHVAQGGKLHVGADAFIALADKAPGQGWLARLFGLPVLRPLAQIAYNRFADLLFWWNKRKGRW
ncbi:MAG: thiol-disulfide oxidoreductase DCC family protein [Sphingomonadales bacterium]